jgi:hypothetical protein
MKSRQKRVLIFAQDSAGLYTTLGLEKTVRATAGVIRARDERRDQCLPVLEICLKFVSGRRDRFVVIAGEIFLAKSYLAAFADYERRVRLFWFAGCSTRN